MKIKKRNIFGFVYAGSRVIELIGEGMLIQFEVKSKQLQLFCIIESSLV